VSDLRDDPVLACGPTRPAAGQRRLPPARDPGPHGSLSRRRGSLATRRTEPAAENRDGAGDWRLAGRLAPAAGIRSFVTMTAAGFFSYTTGVRGISGNRPFRPHWGRGIGLVVLGSPSRAGREPCIPRRSVVFGKDETNNGFSQRYQPNIPAQARSIVARAHLGTHRDYAIVSRPMYGRKTSGTRIEPSDCW
jgi:hypothetical protein